MMDFEYVIQILKSEFPNKAIDLSEGLELLKEVINDTINAINHKSNDAFYRRDFASRRNMMS